MFTNVKNKQYQSIDDYVYKGKKQAVSLLMIMFTKVKKRINLLMIHCQAVHKLCLQT